MKKLAINQIVLGILIIGSFFVFLVFVTPGYYNQEIIDTEGNIIGNVLGLHKLNMLLIIWTFIYPALGLAVLGCGIAQLIQARRNSINKGLIIAQITLGALFLVSMVVFIIWAEPNWQPMPVEREIAGVQAAIIRHSPNWVILLIAWKVNSFILGLGVICCPAAQLIKRGKIAIPIRSGVNLSPINPRTTI